ncbi:DUF2057 family protein [Shewanella maritima]|uniref:DUF2057 family protein n=1 Tax=Shewanella maritima TaxID=2520507 RepID=UPI003736ACE2
MHQLNTHQYSFTLASGKQAATSKGARWLSISLGLFIGLFVNISVNAAELVYDEEVTLIAINGIEVDVDSPATLPQGIGQNNLIQLAFNYRTSYTERSNRKQFNSDVIVLTFNSDAESENSANSPHEQYRLQLPDIRSARDARNFNQQPQLSFTNSQGDEVDYKLAPMRKSGLQFGRDYQQELLEFNQSNAESAVKALVTDVNLVATASLSSVTTPQGASNQNKANAATPTTQSAVSHASQRSVNATAVPVAETAAVTATQVKTIEQDQAEIMQMLDYWYQKATPETKAKFKQKINQ